MLYYCEVCGYCIMVVIFKLIQQCDFYISNKWPLQPSIIWSIQYVGEYRHMSEPFPLAYTSMAIMYLLGLV